MKKLICQLTINFNNSILISINIDYFLVPFDFKFEVFNYNNKSFNTNIDIYLKLKEYREFKETNYEVRPYKFPLHFQVILPNFSYNGNIEFTTS